jgi:hypothetical protein
MARKNSNLISSNAVITGFTQKPTITADQTVLSGLDPIDLDRVDVYKNGILLLSAEDYAVNSITQITMTTALQADDDIVIQSIAHGYVNSTPLTIDNITVGQYPTVVAGNNQLTLSQAINTNSTLVFKNGVLLKEASDYTVLNNTRIDTIDPLDVNDVIHVRSTMDTGTTVTQMSSGSAANPGLSFTDDPDTGIFNNVDANTLSVAAGGNEVATFTADGIQTDGTIQDSQGNVRALEITTDSTTSVTIASGSTGKYFRLTGAATTTININAGNFAAGDIITIHNATSSDMTIDFDANFTDTVYIAGDGTDKNNSTITLAGYGLATCIAFTSAGMIISGNVS